MTCSPANSLRTRIVAKVTRFLRADGGSLGLSFALLAPALAAGIGIAVDMSTHYGARSRAQASADSAALAVAREMSLASRTTDGAQVSADRMARANLGAHAAGARIGATVAAGGGEVTVDIGLDSHGHFQSLLGVGPTRINVSATARLVGTQKICMIALNPVDNLSVSLVKDAKLTASDCSVFSNAKHQHGLSAKDNAVLTARHICSAGGYEGTATNYRPVPKRDCPAIPDPLSKRPPPTMGGCDHNGKVVEDGTTWLRPGVYCGGLKITKNAIVKLDPGIYVIKDGKLVVDSSATLEGRHVGIHFTGSGSVFEFDTGTTISLEAPRDGEMSGILFSEARDAPPGAKHMIRSNNAHTLLGTIYLPRGYLHVDAQAPISQRAAYTIIVADRVEMISGPELFLNSNYGATDIPVPPGVGPVKGSPTLVR